MFLEGFLAILDNFLFLVSGPIFFGQLIIDQRFIFLAILLIFDQFLLVLGLAIPSISFTF